jgi:hypothetical protein
MTAPVSHPLGRTHTVRSWSLTASMSLGRGALGSPSQGQSQTEPSHRTSENSEAAGVTPTPMNASDQAGNWWRVGSIENAVVPSFLRHSSQAWPSASPSGRPAVTNVHRPRCRSSRIAATTAEASSQDPAGHPNPRRKRCSRGFVASIASIASSTVVRIASRSITDLAQVQTFEWTIRT